MPIEIDNIKKLYACSVCGCLYAKYTQAKNCEMSHYTNRGGAI